MNDKYLYLALLLLICIGIGVFIGMQITKTKIITRTELQSFNRDSIRAVILSESLPGFADSIHATIKPKYRYIRETKTDTVETKIVETLYKEATKELEGYVAQGETHTPDYSLWEQFHFESKQFSHQLDIHRKLDTLVIHECDTTFLEDVIQYGKYTLIGIIAFFIGHNL